MPKYRQLYTKIVDSYDMAAMPDDFTRLFYILLFVILDREGRGVDNPAWLRSKMYPLREDVSLDQINAAMVWIEKRGMIIRYEVDGKKYFVCPKFCDLQSGREKEAESTIPAPAQELLRNSSEPTTEKVSTYSASIQCNAINNAMQMQKQGKIQPFSGVAPEQVQSVNSFSQEFDPFALGVFRAVTGMVAIPGDAGPVLNAIDALRSKYSTEHKMIDYLKPFFGAWVSRGWSRTNNAWLTSWAVANDIPKQKKSKIVTDRNEEILKDAMERAENGNQ
ncbi:MAG: hypothetical protein ABFD24_09475 [Anaerolineaceae bacterium]